MIWRPNIFGLIELDNSNPGNVTVISSSGGEDTVGNITGEFKKQ